MGNALDKPVVTKHTQSGCCGKVNSTTRLEWAVSSMQGWRIHMEDAHVAERIETVEVDDTEWGRRTVNLVGPHYFFAVLDGHGGTMAAEYASEHLFRILCEQPSFQEYAKLAATPEEQETRKGKKKGKRKSSRNRAKLNRDYETEEQMTANLQRALEDAFVEMDLQLLRAMVKDNSYTCPCPGGNDSPDEEGGEWGVELADPELEILPTPSDNPQSVSGSTVTAVLVTPDFVVCANAGDSRTVLDTFSLSTDHKPTLPEEYRRINAANGTVAFNRVEGELATSRALGDFEYKNYNASHLDDTWEIEQKRQVARLQKVSPFPEVRVHYRTDTDRILTLACDGIWDVMSNQQCHELVGNLCKEGESDVGLIAEEVLDTCLKKGSRDNMTALIVRFPGQEIGSGGGVMSRRKRRQKH